ncbi:hypothetical protein [Geotalea toluenoxydans]|uniref:hypothetical protein n=1 Tax=Geotalea toluenoxydans TaxID=421624 RepID=UPI0006CF81C9
MQIHSSTNSTLRYRHILFFLCLLIYLPGCFAPKQVKAPVFFPPAPDAPHVQYLTSISSINDIKSSIFADTPGVNEVIAKPYGIAVRGSKIFITDVPLGRITTIDLNEKTFHQLDTEILKSPINISFDDEGNAFVADTGSKKVIRFNGDNPTGTFSIGDMKQLMRPSGEKNCTWLITAAVRSRYLTCKPASRPVQSAGTAKKVRPFPCRPIWHWTRMGISMLPTWAPVGSSKWILMARC